MPVTWKSPSRFKPALILKRIAAVRTVNPTGGASYEGFELEDCLPTLQSMLQFPAAASEVDVQTLAWKALSRVGTDLNPDTFLDAINKTLREKLAVRQTKYFVLTELSLDPTALPSTQRILDCSIEFAPSGHSKRFDSRKDLFARHRLATTETPANYLAVKVEVVAKSDDAAFGKAMRSLDLLRALLCLMGNSRMEFSIGSSPSRQPINAVRLGSRHTVHLPDGSSSRDGLWYEPEFRPTKLYKPKKPEVVARNARWAMKRIKGSKYREALVSSLLRFVRALDHQDPNVAFVRLWSALETLTTPGRADYDKLVQRTAFLFRDNEYHTQVLEHLREYRNANVHAGEESSNARTHCFQLQMYYVNAAWFYIRNAIEFASLDAANEFLDLPPDPRELKRRAALIKRGIRFTSPSDA